MDGLQDKLEKANQKMVATPDRVDALGPIRKAKAKLISDIKKMSVSSALL